MPNTKNKANIVLRADETILDWLQQALPYSTLDMGTYLSYNYDVMSGRTQRLKNNLTLKQTKLVKVISDQIKNDGDINLTKAGLEVYDTTNAASAAVMAHQTLKIPKVSDSIEEVLRAQGLTIEVISQNIGKIANHTPEKFSGDTVLKANLEMAKLLGYGTKKGNSTINFNYQSKVTQFSFNEAKEQLEKMKTETGELIQEAEIELPT